ncbi:MAG: M48 family metallopeptidase [Rikenellaceae bacterium]|nr:M48 family metallopeptidase [Rikenellaceae bacterium]
MKQSYNHPLLGPIEIERVARARNIRISVRRGRVRVAYPWFSSRERALQFLETKLDWVRTTLEKQQHTEANRIIRPPFRSRKHELRIVTDEQTTRPTVRVTRDAITVRCASSVEIDGVDIQELIRGGITEALRREARELLPTMVESVSRRTGLSYRSISVRATRSKWGSCSSRNDLSLSVYLMLLPDHLIEYIIIHELCHTVHRNHSAAFHALVDQHLGGREKELNRELKQYHPLQFAAYK